MTEGFLPLQELLTARLRLRPFHAEDVDDVLAYASDPEWSRYLVALKSAEYTRADAEHFVTQALVEPWETHPLFAIELEGRVVGSINLHVEPERRLAALGYGIGRAYWGLGLTPEAARAVIDWGFATYDLVKVYATTDARNLQSIRVLEKLGMQCEGLLRKQRFFRGENVDEVWYGILREEWPAGGRAG